MMRLTCSQFRLKPGIGGRKLTLCCLVLALPLTACSVEAGNPEEAPAEAELADASSVESALTSSSGVKYWSSHFACISHENGRTIANAQIQFLQRGATREVTGFAFNTTPGDPRGSFSVRLVVLETFRRFPGSIDTPQEPRIEYEHLYRYGGTGRATYLDAARTLQGYDPFTPEATGQQRVKLWLTGEWSWTRHTDYCKGYVYI